MIIDHIEGDIAVVIGENGYYFKVHTGLLPRGIREGTLLLSTPNGYVIDEEREDFRRERMKSKTNSVFTPR